MSDKIKILLAEDEPFLSGMYQTKLKIAGYDINAAGDGEEALEKLDKEEFDMILLDIMMPKLNGFEVLNNIRNSKNKKLASTPVIILTNLGQKTDIEKGLLLGANDYIVKANFTPTEVVDKIKKHLNENPPEVSDKK